MTRGLAPPLLCSLLAGSRIDGDEAPAGARKPVWGCPHEVGGTWINEHGVEAGPWGERLTIGGSGVDQDEGEGPELPARCRVGGLGQGAGHGEAPENDTAGWTWVFLDHHRTASKTARRPGDAWVRWCQHGDYAELPPVGRGEGPREADKVLRSGVGREGGWCDGNEKQGRCDGDESDFVGIGCP